MTLLERIEYLEGLVGIIRGREARQSQVKESRGVESLRKIMLEVEGFITIPQIQERLERTGGGFSKVWIGRLCRQLGYAAGRVRVEGRQRRVIFGAGRI